MIPRDLQKRNFYFQRTFFLENYVSNWFRSVHLPKFGFPARICVSIFKVLLFFSLNFHFPSSHPFSIPKLLFFVGFSCFFSAFFATFTWHNLIRLEVGSHTHTHTHTQYPHSKKYVCLLFCFCFAAFPLFYRYFCIVFFFAATKFTSSINLTKLKLELPPMGASEIEPMEEREARHAVTESLNYTHAHQQGGQVK